MSHPEVAWYRNPGLRTLYLLLPIVILSSSYQGFDGMIMNGLQLLPSWQEAWTLVGAVLQGSAKHIAAFLIAGFLIGWGLAYTVVASPLLLAELALARHRGTILAYFPATWYTGAIIAAWTTYGTQFIQNSWSWRIPSLLQALPAIIQISLIWLVPESPRWLVSRGRGAEARAILVKYHANGDESDPIVEFEYTQIKEAILHDAQWKRQSSYLDFIRTKPNRRRLIIVTLCGLFLEISGNGLVQYYLHAVLNSIGITKTIQQTTINGCLAIYNFLVAIGASFLVERVGRRKLFIFSTAGMFVAFILWTAFAALYTTRGSLQYSYGVLVCIFLSNGAYSLGWTPLWAYPAEILPFEIRARGVTYMTGVMHIFGFFSAFVNPIGLENIGWKYYIAFVVYTLLELIAVWYFFVETKGYNLEEIASIFEAPGLSWKQRRNLRAPTSRASSSAEEETGERQKAGDVTDVKEL
ncbi:hypothetical protein F5X68DRAFT_272897 [Plectosphaerella plurivora]|uniref:Major facilitator superfamily (MFS) profile domain-containing protein n=1 Tax=Plectosphaerella plurivora TaxID=936078 RepID=A0A9P8VN51_9PEZI|nr:hypothetical protein F5X68DRAFT_272897 [Plectosphaerella plurivora]